MVNRNSAAKHSGSFTMRADVNAPERRREPRQDIGNLLVEAEQGGAPIECLIWDISKLGATTGAFAPGNIIASSLGAESQAGAVGLEQG